MNQYNRNAMLPGNGQSNGYYNGVPPQANMYGTSSNIIQQQQQQQYNQYNQYQNQMNNMMSLMNLMGQTNPYMGQSLYRGNGYPPTFPAFGNMPYQTPSPGLNQNPQTSNRIPNPGIESSLDSLISRQTQQFLADLSKFISILKCYKRDVNIVSPLTIKLLGEVVENVHDVLTAPNIMFRKSDQSTVEIPSTLVEYFKKSHETKDPIPETKEDIKDLFTIRLPTIGFREEVTEPLIELSSDEEVAPSSNITIVEQSIDYPTIFGSSLHQLIEIDNEEKKKYNDEIERAKSCTANVEIERTDGDTINIETVGAIGDTIDIDTEEAIDGTGNVDIEGAVGGIVNIKIEESVLSTNAMDIDEKLFDSTNNIQPERNEMIEEIDNNSSSEDFSGGDKETKLTTENSVLFYTTCQELRNPSNYDQILKHLSIQALVGYPGYTITLFGSRMYGMASKQSNLDMYVTFPQPHEQYKVIRTKLTNRLRRGMFRVIKPSLWNDKSPYIRVVHQPSRIVCAIYFPNDMYVKATECIKYIFQLQPIAHFIAIEVRQWALKTKLLQHFKVYTLTILVIFYLQSINLLPPIDAFNSNKKPIEMDGYIPITFKPLEFRIPLPEPSVTNIKFHVLEFFRYYRDFDYENFIICPLVGKPMARYNLFNELNEGNGLKRLYHYLEKKKVRQRNLQVALFDIDRQMGIQCPFDLFSNLGGKTGTLHQFLNECSKMIEYLSVN